MEDAQQSRALKESVADEKAMLAREQDHRRLEQVKLRNQLEVQLREQEEARRLAYKEYLRDKQRIDEVAKLVREDQER